VSRIYAKATIKLPGLARGEVRAVNPEAPYVKACLENGYLVRVAKPETDKR
jgi:hypothetical protein